MLLAMLNILDFLQSNTTKSYTSTDLSKPTGKEKTENGVNRTESTTLSGNQHDPQEYLHQTILQAPDNEEEQREIAKKRIQLYVFCLRAIAYPFNTKVWLIPMIYLKCSGIKRVVIFSKLKILFPYAA